MTEAITMIQMRRSGIVSGLLHPHHTVVVKVHHSKEIVVVGFLSSDNIISAVCMCNNSDSAVLAHAS